MDHRYLNVQVDRYLGVEPEGEADYCTNIEHAMWAANRFAEQKCVEVALIHEPQGETRVHVNQYGLLVIMVTDEPDIRLAIVKAILRFKSLLIQREVDQ